MATRTSWTRDELVLALNLYLRLPFGRMHQSNPEVVALAALIGRTPGSVAMRLGNFAALDPALDRRGMANASAGARTIWDEWGANPDAVAEESERILRERRQPSLLDAVEREIEEPRALPEGIERAALVSVRVNQAFFRRLILARYDATCVVTGLRVPELLVAAHIVPWAEAPEHRMDPRNGLCLNGLHDRAFERGLIVVDNDLRVRVSPRLNESAPQPVRDLLLRYDGVPLTLTGDTRPSREFLARHRARFAA